MRIGLVCRMLLGDDVKHARITFYGSFADTGLGHGTDKALIAGLLGMEPDDERIPHSFEYAEKAGLEFSFGVTELRAAHPNSVLLKLRGKSGAELEIVGASVGGGRIQIRRLGGMELCFTAEQPTLIVKNEDQPGSVADVSRVLAQQGINIGTFQVNRDGRGGCAVMVIECDAPIRQDVVNTISNLPGILGAVCIN